MTEILCLANSLKYGDRCIAGIELATGKWVRPMSDLKDGRITAAMRLVDGVEPAPLDVLEIPLRDGDESGSILENRSLLPGAWKRVGRVQPADVLQYCRESEILHNDQKFVTVTYLESLKFSERYTIQLVYAQEFSVRGQPRGQGGRSWKGSLVTKTGRRLTNAIITDPVLLARLESGDSPQVPQMIVTVSLGMPYRPASGWEGDDPCWKMISGAIALTQS
jgi:hypothetical protein